MLRILVIDAQGGGIGKQIISGLRARKLPVSITAVGTNTLATTAMLRAGADAAATGENAVIVGCRRAEPQGGSDHRAHRDRDRGFPLRGDQPCHGGRRGKERCKTSSDPCQQMRQHHCRTCKRREPGYLYKRRRPDRGRHDRGEYRRQTGRTLLIPESDIAGKKINCYTFTAVGKEAYVYRQEAGPLRRKRRFFSGPKAFFIIFK